MKKFSHLPIYLILMILLSFQMDRLYGQKINSLKITIKTGDDDLRGGNDNAYITAMVNCDHFYPTADCSNLMPISERISLNQGQRWKDRSQHERIIYLKEAISVSTLKAITIETTFTGGISGDNWNIDDLLIEGFGPDDFRVILFNERGKPWRRLTGDRKSVTIQF